ncbi:hypothetical protein HWN40_03835 [Methanolobus zinderi]|uniref:Uncharacterized protein n=1 Tax=Methanolobus zinderi TaxID=536044 RepID=A0A7D5E7I5_9EURY|nr:hypothetical protein [Methanolobus zinderi]QLC49451.1 hypothetical protein HWN40_03835 [Methanolobus zinderi]
MLYKRYLLAGVILLTIILLIMFAEFMAGPTTEYLQSENTHNLKIDTIGTAVLVFIPPALAGFYIVARHRMKKREK